MVKSADAFRTISEVADWLGVQTHVLRFWESKFTQIKPVKRAGGRRYYRPADMLLLGGIRKLLHGDGLTIKGVQKILREEGIAHVADMSCPLEDDVSAQIEGDFVQESNFVEVELAPISEAEDTVTLFPTAARQEAAEPDPEPEHVPEHQPEGTSEPPFTQAEPESEPMIGLADLDMPEGSDTPDVAAGPSATEPFAPAPEPLFGAAEQPTTPADTPQELDVSLKSEAGPDDVTAKQEGLEDAVPDLPLMPDSPTFDADPSTDFGARPQKNAHNSDTEATYNAPSMERPTVPEDKSEAPVLTSVLSAPMTVAESQREPPLPRPRIVDVPEDVDPETLKAAPSILSRIAHVRHLTGAQRTALRPILAQLTALRDKMSQTGPSHGDPQ